MGLSCKICGFEKTTKLNTQKHYWYYCNNCKSAFSKKKNHWLLRQYPLEKVISVIKGKRHQSLEDNQKIYDYMVTQGHIEHHEKRRLYERFVDKLVNPIGLGLTGKSVLDISGGNGSFANKLKNEGANLVLTEFNQASVDFAKKHYNLEAIKYDFNSDNISALLGVRKFDIILLRAAIMFCVDLEKLFKELKLISKDETIIIIESSVIPNSRVVIEWQKDEYNLLRLYSSEFLRTVFKKSGLKVIFDQPRPNDEDRLISNYRTDEFRNYSIHYKIHVLFWKYFYLVPILFKGLPKSNLEEAHDFVLKYDTFMGNKLNT